MRVYGAETQRRLAQKEHHCDAVGGVGCRTWIKPGERYTLLKSYPKYLSGDSIRSAKVCAVCSEWFDLCEFDRIIGEGL